MPPKQMFFLIDLVRRVRKEKGLVPESPRRFLSRIEYYLLTIMTRKVEHIPGDIAEVGVYKGGSAKIILEATKKQVHLFDTFEGLPGEEMQFYKGQYSNSYEDVMEYLKEYPNVHIFKGLFPTTSVPIFDKKFSLVHLDVDLYMSTLICLKFFYPRMSTGGVIISHDYTLSTGVKNAFDEFFKDKTEVVVVPLLGASQCYVIKQ